MQETQVQFLVQEDPTCHGATKLLSLCSAAWGPQLLKLMSPRAHLSDGEAITMRSLLPQLERVAPAHHN